MSEAAINRTAIQAMIASQATFSVSDTMVKLATAQVSAGEIMAIRGLFGTGLLVLALLVMGHGRSLAHLAQPVVLLRAGLECVISLLFVLSIGLMPIANYTAIIQSAPLMITALSVVLFSAPVGWRRWLAVFTGFAGVLLVARPDAGGFGPAAILAVACAFLVAVRDLVTRRVPANVPSHVVTLASTAATMLLGLGLTAISPLVAPAAINVAELALAAIAVTTANFFVIMACRKADLAVVAPFRYSVMPFALLSGYLVWGNVPDRWGALGILLVCGSGLYAFYRERLRAKTAARG